MNSEERKKKGISIRWNPNEYMRFLLIITAGILFGFFIGLSFPVYSPSKIEFVPRIDSYVLDNSSGHSTQTILNVISVTRDNISKETGNVQHPSKIRVSSNPRGAERLPRGIVASESDLYPRRLYGQPSEDLKSKPNYLLTFTVGYNQKYNIDKAIKKFSDNFTIVLFHYDGQATEWDEFEWSKPAIHISVANQTKWWYAKRFLHPDIVAPYDYIFMWDEDLGVDHFDAEEYIKLVRKHKLEISQPGLDLSSKGLTWRMTKRRRDHEVHKQTDEKRGRCSDPHLPPCAAFVEIMAPVFSRESWRCVWHLIQNDLIHGWGLDFSLHKCVEPAHEKIGVVDAQWIVHQGLPSLGNQGKGENGKKPWQGVRDRCKNEMKLYRERVSNADKDYYKSIRVDSANLTRH